MKTKIKMLCRMGSPAGQKLEKGAAYFLPSDYAGELVAKGLAVYALEPQNGRIADSPLQKTENEKPKTVPKDMTAAKPRTSARRAKIKSRADGKKGGK